MKNGSSFVPGKSFSINQCCYVVVGRGEKLSFVFADNGLTSRAGKFYWGRLDAR
ncbi:MAG: hypothetical protein LW808_003160 [Verrucomicrobiota bacterium]|nr:MAG: hypothetical protein LW808_003160 [Verrucomicrobiota bacterium]